MLGLGNVASSATSMITPGVVTGNLVMKHMYPAGAVQPVSDGATYFNGSSDYIAIGAKPVDTADATYVFWTKSSVASGTDNRSIFGHGAERTGEFSTNHITTGKPLLYLHSNLYQYWVDTGFQSDGQWHHWAVVVDISDMTACKLYIDGVLIAQDTRQTPGTINAYGNMEIGRADASNEYEGYLCNFGVWTGALTQAQIKSIMWKQYADLSTTEKTDLVSWWNLDTDANDSHGSNHGTLT